MISKLEAAPEKLMRQKNALCEGRSHRIPHRFHTTLTNMSRITKTGLIRVIRALRVSRVLRVTRALELLGLLEY